MLFIVKVAPNHVLTWVRGGPGALERAREAADSIVELGALTSDGEGGALHIQVDHDDGCPALVKRSIGACTCLNVGVNVRALSRTDRAVLETTGDYEHVRDHDPDTGEMGLAMRRRWPAEGGS
jgi:hypothetical protein